MTLPPNKLCDPIQGKRHQRPVHIRHALLTGAPRILLKANREDTPGVQGAGIREEYMMRRLLKANREDIPGVQGAGIREGYMMHDHP